MVRKKEKKGVNKLVIVVLVLVIGVSVIYFAGSGIVDLFNTLTGRATTDTTSLNLTIGNTAPTLVFVSPIASTDPVEDGTRTFIINFTADDDDGAGDLTSPRINLTSSGEPVRFNSSCNTLDSSFGNSQNYTCTIYLYYFDANAVWTINASITDSGGSIAVNDTNSFTYNLLTAMKMGPTSLAWPALTITSTNLASNTDPITLNNTGNDVITNIRVTGVDLPGETTPGEFIYAGNFTSNTADASEGTVMVNGTATQVSTANFTRGNYSINDGSTGQEELYFYLESLNPDLSSQSYSSIGSGEWTIAIIT